MADNNDLNFEYLPEPIPITEQQWPEGTIPLVTTKTMAFMQENYIRECIEGILMQKTTFPVQVLIHDDASTDRTADIIASYERIYPRLVHAIYQKENTHTSSRKRELRQTLYTHLTGKYIALCEGDDYWTDPLKLQKQAEFLEANPDFGLVHTDNSTQNEDSGQFDEHSSRRKRCYPPSGWVFDDLLMNNFISALTVMYRRDVYEKARVSLLSWIDPKITRDIALWLEISRISKVKYLDCVTATYRVLKGSVSRNPDPVKEAVYLGRGLEIMLAFIDHYAVSESYRIRCINRFIDDHLESMTRKQIYFRDLRTLLRAYKPSSLKKILYKSMFKFHINPTCIELGFRAVRSFTLKLRAKIK